MRVLMFGWEFPPHISGGLGTVCYELTRVLTRHGVHVSFVLPKLLVGPPRSSVKLVSAASVPVEAPGEATREFLKLLTTHAVDSALRPYLTEPEYAEILTRTEQRLLQSPGVAVQDRARRIAAAAVRLQPFKPQWVFRSPARTLADNFHVGPKAGYRPQPTLCRELCCDHRDRPPNR